MKKANIVVIVLVGILILCFCVSGVLLFRGINQFSKEEKTLNRARKTLDNYYASNPFPSSENEANEKRNGEVLRRWLTGLSDSLRETDSHGQGRQSNAPLTASRICKKLTEKGFSTTTPP